MTLNLRNFLPTVSQTLDKVIGPDWDAPAAAGRVLRHLAKACLCSEKPSALPPPDALSTFGVNRLTSDRSIVLI